MFKKISMAICIIFIILFTISCKENSNNVEWFVSTLKLNEISSLDSSNVKVAILDTGYNKKIIDKYKERFINQYNFINDSKNIESSVNYHGSNIVSLILGDLDEYGYENEASVIPIVVADDFGHTNSTILAEGIRYAVDNYAQIICISMGSYFDYSCVKESIEYAISKKTIVIAASGDKAYDNILYPAQYEGVYSISSQAKDGSLAINANYNSKCIKIPGENIKTINYIDENEFYYTYSSGSSYSTAIFAGIVYYAFSIFKDSELVKKQFEKPVYDDGFICLDDMVKTRKLLK